MNLTLRRMPGGAVPPTFRILFQDHVPGSRPLAERRVVGAENLKNFLHKRIHARMHDVDRVVGEVSASSHVTFLENIPLDATELKSLMRTLDAEEEQELDNPTPVRQGVRSSVE